MSVCVRVHAWVPSVFSFELELSSPSLSALELLLRQSFFITDEQAAVPDVCLFGAIATVLLLLFVKLL